MGGGNVGKGLSVMQCVNKCSVTRQIIFGLGFLPKNIVLALIILKVQHLFKISSLFVCLFVAHT